MMRHGRTPVRPATNVNLADYGVKTSVTTGTISAGSDALTLTSATGFAIGDQIIVELGGEAGAGLRGTVGVGGVWPALSYADATARDADTSQADGTYAWLETDGTVHRFVSGAWEAIPETSYYTHKAQPKALVAEITDLVGNVATLSKTASVASTGASVYFDNEPVLTALVGEGGSLTASDHILSLPAGSFAISGRIRFFERTCWTLKGQGPDATEIFSPKGVPSANIWLEQCHGFIVRDLHVRGNVADDGFGMWLTSETALLGNGHSYPRGVFYNICYGGLVQNVKATDVWQGGVATLFATDVWAVNCDVILSQGLREYIQWMMVWSDSTRGGAVDCTITSPHLTSGLESFRSRDVQFVRPVLVNASISLNSSGGTIIDAPSITVEANSQLSENSFSRYKSLIEINANIDPDEPLLLLGGQIRNPTIVQEGYINANQNVLTAINVAPEAVDIVVSGGYPSNPAQGGLIQAPDYIAPIDGLYTDGPRGFASDGDATVTGIRVIGTPKPSPGSQSNSINFSDATKGTVTNCVADSIRAANQSGNQTNAEYLGG